MQFARFAARADLADALDHVWLLTGESGADTPPQPQPIWSDGCGEWVFQLAEPFQQQTEAGDWQRQPQRLLVGQQWRRVLVRPGRRVRCLGLHFHPAGMACFVAGDLRRFTGRIGGLDEALGLDLQRLGAQLGRLGDAAAAKALQAWLGERRTTAGEPHLLRAVEALQKSAVELPRLAAELGWSERQLRRRFETAVGLAPKRYARLARFQRVLAAGRLDDAQAWAEAALDGGYCDQSHFNRDFRAFTGVSPRTLLRDPAPLTAFFAAMSDSSKTGA